MSNKIKGKLIPSSLINQHSVILPSMLLGHKNEALLCQRAISICRQYCFGFLGLISAVLLLGWRYSYVATPNDPTLVVSKPSQNA